MSRPPHDFSDLARGPQGGEVMDPRVEIMAEAACGHDLGDQHDDQSEAWRKTARDQIAALDAEGYTVARLEPTAILCDDDSLILITEDEGVMSGDELLFRIVESGI